MASSNRQYYVQYVTKYGESPDTETGYMGATAGMEIISGVDELPVLTYPYGIFQGWYWTETFDEDTKAEIGTVGGSKGLNVTNITPSNYTYTLYAKWESEQHLYNAMDLQNIADAIREYTGATAGLKPGEWASTFAEGG